MLKYLAVGTNTFSALLVKHDSFSNEHVKHEFFCYTKTKVSQTSYVSLEMQKKSETASDKRNNNTDAGIGVRSIGNRDSDVSVAESKSVETYGMGLIKNPV